MIGSHKFIVFIIVWNQLFINLVIESIKIGLYMILVQTL